MYRILTLPMVLMLFTWPAHALSIKCPFKEETEDLIQWLARAKNVVEAKVKDVRFDLAKANVTLHLKTIEVFRGEEINTFNIDFDIMIVGYLVSKKCDEDGTWKNSNLTCKFYKSLIGKNVILAGRSSEALCHDSVVEMDTFPRSDLMRGFLRFIGPAIKQATGWESGKFLNKGLPGKYARILT